MEYIKTFVYNVAHISNNIKQFVIQIIIFTTITTQIYATIQDNIISQKTAHPYELN